MTVPAASTTPHFAIAIDGPAASGKSTIARELAKRLGLVMVNSGAMYRAVTWQALQQQLDPHDRAAVVGLLDTLDIRCGDDGATSTITINGVDPGEALRSPEVNAQVSAIAAIPEVRNRLVALQRDYLSRTNVVMEGRDIGSVVFPEATLKLYVTASPRVRAERRVAEIGGDVADVEASIIERDRKDSTRADSPLTETSDAVLVDTTGLTVDEVVERVLGLMPA